MCNFAISYRYLVDPHRPPPVELLQLLRQHPRLLLLRVPVPRMRVELPPRPEPPEAPPALRPALRPLLGLPQVREAVGGEALPVPELLVAERAALAHAGQGVRVRAVATLLPRLGPNVGK